MNNLTGEGENSTIHRNDSILFLIYALSGMTSFSRDVSELSTKNATRSDQTQMYNNIPLINVEEKSDEIENARNDLVRKFEWLPHCNMLPFVFGIAISIKRFQIYLMTSDNEWTAKQPIVNVNIEEIVDRTQCLLYAVNVARVLKFFIQKSWVSSL